jgi:two-component system, chemotaxis family, chemotaxis protein CheY
MSKVLSVDDSAVMRKIIGRVVDVLGYGLAEAGNGHEALAYLEKDYQDVALMILDVNMPEMDGFQLLAAVKAHPRFRHIPVMMVTTESDRARIVEAIQAGAVNYVCKPFRQEDLLSKIASSLGSTFE